MRHVALLLLIALTMTACGSSPVDPAGTADDAPNGVNGDVSDPETPTTDMTTALAGTSWALRQGTVADTVMDGSVGGPVPTFNVGDAEISGTDTCNNYGAAITISAAGKITVGPVRMTRKFCEGNAFDAFTAAIEQVTTARFIDDELHLTGPEGLELLFKRP